MNAARPPVVVLGGGIAGLISANELARHGVAADVYEAGPRLAGMAASHIDADGFSYDIGAHFVTNRFVGALGMPGPFHTLPRYAEVVHLGPGRDPLYPLGLLGVPRYVTSAAAERVRRPRRDLAVASERFRHDYGPALADEVALPLLEAWSGLPADQLSASVIDKIPTSLLQTVWLRAAQHLSRRAVMIGYCKEAPSAVGVYHVAAEGARPPSASTWPTTSPVPCNSSNRPRRSTSTATASSAFVCTVATSRPTPSSPHSRSIDCRSSCRARIGSIATDASASAASCSST